MRILGSNPILTDPLELLGFILIICTMTILFILALKTYINYSRTKLKPTLAISLTFLLWGFAMFFLFIERTFPFFSINPISGAYTSYLALILSVFGLVCLNLFASYITYPHRRKILKLLSIILSVIFLIVAIYSFRDIELIPPTEIQFPHYFNYFISFIVLPLFVIPIFLFFHYSYNTRIQSPPHAKRILLLGIAVILILVTYFPEIIASATLANILRIFYLAAVLIFYICFTRFIELNWPQKIRHLYVIFPEKGISLFDYSFKQEETMESQFIASTLSGFVSMIQKFIKSEKKLRIVDYEDVKLLMASGRFIAAILITEENYPILRKKLDAFVQEFELHFENELSAFSGSVRPFQTAKALIENIFSYKEPF